MKTTSLSEYTLRDFIVSFILIVLFALGTISCSMPATPVDRYALVYGIQDYPGSDNDLNYPDDDAESMASLLEDRGWTVVEKRINSEATYANIEADIADIATESDFDENSTVLVYYSGHGSSYNGTGYIIPYDGITEGGSAVLDNWITPAEMSQWLGALSCQNKILILDSCYSGSFVDTSSSQDASPQNYGYYEDGTGTSFIAAGISNLSELLAANASAEGDPEVVTITAAGSEEYSYDDSSREHGAFTYYLLKAADGGDGNGDGYVSCTEAFSYAANKIKTVWDSACTDNTSSLFYSFAADLEAYYADYGMHIMVNTWAEFYYYAGYVPDFLPHISGGAGDLVLYVN